MWNKNEYLYWKFHVFNIVAAIIKCLKEQRFGIHCLLYSLSGIADTRLNAIVEDTTKTEKKE